MYFRFLFGVVTLFFLQHANAQIYPPYDFEPGERQNIENSISNLELGHKLKWSVQVFTGNYDYDSERIFATYRPAGNLRELEKMSFGTYDELLQGMRTWANGIVLSGESDLDNVVEAILGGYLGPRSLIQGSESSWALYERDVQAEAIDHGYWWWWVEGGYRSWYPSPPNSTTADRSGNIGAASDFGALRSMVLSASKNGDKVNLHMCREWSSITDHYYRQTALNMSRVQRAWYELRPDDHERPCDHYFTTNGSIYRGQLWECPGSLFFADPFYPEWEKCLGNLKFVFRAQRVDPVVIVSIDNETLDYFSRIRSRGEAPEDIDDLNWPFIGYPFHGDDTENYRFRQAYGEIQSEINEYKSNTVAWDIDTPNVEIPISIKDDGGYKVSNEEMYTVFNFFEPFLPRAEENSLVLPFGFHAIQLNNLSEDPGPPHHLYPDFERWDSPTFYSGTNILSQVSGLVPLPSEVDPNFAEVYSGLPLAVAALASQINKTDTYKGTSISKEQALCISLEVAKHKHRTGINIEGYAALELKNRVDDPSVFVDPSDFDEIGVASIDGNISGKKVYTLEEKQNTVTQILQGYEKKNQSISTDCGRQGEFKECIQVISAKDLFPISRPGDGDPPEVTPTSRLSFFSDSSREVNLDGKVVFVGHTWTKYDILNNSNHPLDPPGPTPPVLVEVKNHRYYKAWDRGFNHVARVAIHASLFQELNEHYHSRKYESKKLREDSFRKCM